MHVLKRFAMGTICLSVLIAPLAVRQAEGNPSKPYSWSIKDENRLRQPNAIAAEQVRQERIQEYVDNQANWAALAAAAERDRAVAIAKWNAAQHTNTPSQTGSGRCGGSLPPCYIMMRESRGDIHAKNPNSSASGKWQFMDSTWNGYSGYAHASDAPESVQDAKARKYGLADEVLVTGHVVRLQDLHVI